MRTTRTAALALLAILTGALAFPGEPPAKPDQPNKDHKPAPPDPKPEPTPAPSICGQCKGVGKTPLAGGLWRVCNGCLGAKVAPDLPTQEARDAFLAKRGAENAAVDAYASALSAQDAADEAINQRTRDGRRFSLTPASVARKRQAAADAWAKVRELEAKVGHPIAAPDPAADAVLAAIQKAEQDQIQAAKAAKQ
jgi:hypothetical protein